MDDSNTMNNDKICCYDNFSDQLELIENLPLSKIASEAMEISKDS